MHESIRQAISDEGFVLCGVAPAVSTRGYSDLLRWIESGYAGEMHYFADRIDAYREPGAVLAGTKSIVALAFPYDRSGPPELPRGRGRVARYAWSGDDYHDTLHPKLKRLRALLQASYPGSVARGVVDTAPLMEREIAELAGLGWRGKNTLLINKTLGSYFFLACLLTSEPLTPDEPHRTQHCGTCTACLQACPTNAFPQPGVLDATRCISYLTIEHRDHIPTELRAGMGDWLFGCDVCQEVCPWNRKPTRDQTRPPTGDESIDLIALFSLDDEQFRERFRKTPLWRTRRRGILRNAAIVLGNQASGESVPALVRGIEDSEPLIRAASAWALGRIASEPAVHALRGRLAGETDETVREEITAALSLSAL